MPKNLLLLLILLNTVPYTGYSAGKIKMLPFKKEMIGSSHYKGNIVEGKRWEDKNGINILLLTSIEVKYEKSAPNKYGEEEEGRTELYAYHFVMKDTPQLLWKVYDFMGWCGLDVICEFYTNSLTVTDLDNDGEAETMFLYALACKGDVSPSEKKLILHRGVAKYAMRGTSTQIFNKEKLGGEKKADDAFKKIPAIFLAYANRQWSKFGIEKF